MSEEGAVFAQVIEEGAVPAVLAKDGYAFVAYDIERSSGAYDSEMLQIAYACENQLESSYIKS